MQEIDSLPGGEPLQRSSLKDQAVTLLRTLIITGEIAPGTQLVERDVADRLGISRAPTREALFELESQGLVINQRGRRRVIEPTAVELAQMFDVRSPLEERAARRAAELTNATNRAQLLERLAEMRAAVSTRDRSTFVIADLQLHQTIWRQSANTYLERVLNHMSGPIFLAIVNGSFQGFDWDETYELHRALVEAINDGTIDPAGEVAARNMQNAVERNASLSP